MFQYNPREPDQMLKAIEAIYDAENPTAVLRVLVEIYGGGWNEAAARANVDIPRITIINPGWIDKNTERLVREYGLDDVG